MCREKYVNLRVDDLKKEELVKQLMNNDLSVLETLELNEHKATVVNHLDWIAILKKDQRKGQATAKKLPETIDVLSPEDNKNNLKNTYRMKDTESLNTFNAKDDQNPTQIDSKNNNTKSMKSPRRASKIIKILSPRAHSPRLSPRKILKNSPRKILKILGSPKPLRLEKNQFSVNILKSIVEEKISFEKLLLTDCKVLTQNYLVTLLQSSLYLREIDLSNSSGVPNNILKLLEKYCPNIEKVTLDHTDISHLELATLLNLQKLCMENIKELIEIKLNAPKLKFFSSSGCSNLTTIEPGQTLESLRILNLKGCKSFSDKNINMLVNKAPYLEKLILGDHCVAFNTRRLFACSALKQNRFTPTILKGMIQNGVLRFYGLELTENHLDNISRWLRNKEKFGLTNIKISTIDFRGRLKITESKALNFIIQFPGVHEFIMPDGDLLSCQAQELRLLPSLSHTLDISFRHKCPDAFTIKASGESEGQNSLTISFDTNLGDITRWNCFKQVIKILLPHEKIISSDKDDKLSIMSLPGYRCNNLHRMLKGLINPNASNFRLKFSSSTHHQNQDRDQVFTFDI